MANVIISEGLYDRQFVSEWTRGFDEYRAYAATFTLERAEEITGVPAALIREAAVLYATTKPAAMMPSSTPVVAPHQRRAEPAGGGRSGRAHRQLRCPRR